MKSVLCAIAVTITVHVGSVALAQEDRPNILVITADDVGMWNVSAYHRGMMGGSTPNIDRIAADAESAGRKFDVVALVEDVDEAPQ